MPFLEAIPKRVSSIHGAEETVGNMLQKTTNGNLLKVTAGSLAKECCCGGTASSCTGGDPEIYLTVTGNSGTVNWCGEQWLAGDSGVEKGPVCPTTYHKTKGKFTGGNFYSVLEHIWLNNATGQLVLRRVVGDLQTTFVPYPNINRVSGQVGAATFTSYKKWSGSTFVISSQTLNMNTPPSVLGVPVPTPNAYTITDAFFGSATVAGVTYSWRKGNGW